MLEPVFPLLGVPPTVQLLDLTTMFTPQTFALVILCSLCGIMLGVLLDRMRTPHPETTALPDTTPAVPKAA